MPIQYRFRVCPKHMSSKGKMTRSPTLSKIHLLRYTLRRSARMLVPAMKAHFDELDRLYSHKSVGVSDFDFPIKNAFYAFTSAVDALLHTISTDSSSQILYYLGIVSKALTHYWKVLHDDFNIRYMHDSASLDNSIDGNEDDLVARLENSTDEIINLQCSSMRDNIAKLEQFEGNIKNTISPPTAPSKPTTFVFRSNRSKN